MGARFPDALVTLPETQQFLLELDGSTIFHQLLSELLPTICEAWPIFKALIATQAVPGPKRQLTATSLGEATGTVGVLAMVGSAEATGNAVFDGTGVNNGCAGVFVLRSVVAVGVTAAAAGKLQASMLRTSKRLAKNGWYLIGLLLSLLSAKNSICISYVKAVLAAIDLWIPGLYAAVHKVKM